TSGASNTVVAWSDHDQAWLALPAMGQSRIFGGAAPLSGSVFAVGGFDDSGAPTSTAERFDPGSGLWSGAAPMPLARASFGLVSLGGALCVAGGEGASGSMAECFRYDPAGDSWAAIANLPTPRTAVTAAGFGGEVWVIGGYTDSPVATVERFNPSTGMWSSGP